MTKHTNFPLPGLMSLVKPLVVVGIFSLVGWASARLIPAVYQASTSLILLRPVLELPDFKPESMTNRWVWARDGMAIQEGLITDEFLSALGKQIPEVAKDPQAIRKAININFAGAESQYFSIKVDHRDAKIALQIAGAVVQFIKDYLIRNNRTPLEGAISSVDAQLANLSAKADKNTLLRLRTQLQNQLILQQADEARQFRMVSQPSIGAGPIWPKPRLLAALGLVIGVFVVILLELLRRSTRV